MFHRVLGTRGLRRFQTFRFYLWCHLRGWPYFLHFQIAWSRWRAIYPHRLGPLLLRGWYHNTLPARHSDLCMFFNFPMLRTQLPVPRQYGDENGHDLFWLGLWREFNGFQRICFTSVNHGRLFILYHLRDPRRQLYQGNWSHRRCFRCHPRFRTFYQCPRFLWEGRHPAELQWYNLQIPRGICPGTGGL